MPAYQAPDRLRLRVLSDEYARERLPGGGRLVLAESAEISLPARASNPTLRVKVYFIAPGGQKTLFAFGEAGAIGEFGLHRFVLAGKAPALELGALPDPWLAKFPDRSDVEWYGRLALRL